MEHCLCPAAKGSLSPCFCSPLIFSSDTFLGSNIFSGTLLEFLLLQNPTFESGQRRGSSSSASQTSASSHSTASITATRRRAPPPPPPLEKRVSSSAAPARPPSQRRIQTEIGIGRSSRDNGRNSKSTENGASVSDWGSKKKLVQCRQ